jgi:excisionase family DNA binding protein
MISSSDPVNERPALLDIETVAILLSCSTRHVTRLSDAGRMPPPVRLGTLLRWSRSELLAWIDEGCPAGFQSASGSPEEQR